jgi:hypothetical protein
MEIIGYVLQLTYQWLLWLFLMWLCTIVFMHMYMIVHRWLLNGSFLANLLNMNWSPVILGVPFGYWYYSTRTQTNTNSYRSAVEYVATTCFTFLVVLAQVVLLMKRSPWRYAYLTIWERWAFYHSVTFVGVMTLVFQSEAIALLCLAITLISSRWLYIHRDEHCYRACSYYWKDRMMITSPQLPSLMKALQTQTPLPKDIMTMVMGYFGHDVRPILDSMTDDVAARLINELWINIAPQPPSTFPPHKHASMLLKALVDTKWKSEPSYVYELYGHIPLQISSSQHRGGCLYIRIPVWHSPLRGNLLLFTSNHYSFDDTSCHHCEYAGMVWNRYFPHISHWLGHRNTKWNSTLPDNDNNDHKYASSYDIDQAIASCPPSIIDPLEQTGSKHLSSHAKRDIDAPFVIDSTMDSRLSMIVRMTIKEWPLYGPLKPSFEMISVEPRTCCTSS